MKLFDDKIRGTLKEKPLWDKKDLWNRVRHVRITQEDYHQIICELKKSGEIELLNKKIRVK